MTLVKREVHDGVHVLRLQNGSTNALSPRLVAELKAALGEAVGEAGAGGADGADKADGADGPGEARGVVLAGGEKFFSIGLDLPTLLELDRPEMSRFWAGFEETVLELYTLPVPTLAAIGGHATAGGLILALACDFRFATPGRKLLGLNEVRIGVAVPFLAHLMLAQAVGERTARKMGLRGEFLGPQEALAVGLVERLTEGDGEDAVVEEAVREVGVMASFPPLGFGVAKRNSTEAVRRVFMESRQERLEEAMDLWFHQETQRYLREAAKKF